MFNYTVAQLRNKPKWGCEMQKKLTESQWEKLERLWQEEGLSVRVLASRFGVSHAKVSTHLIDKFGTSVSANKMNKHDGKSFG